MPQFNSFERRQRENARNAPLFRRSFNRTRKTYRMDFSPLRDEERDVETVRSSSRRSQRSRAAPSNQRYLSPSPNPPTRRSRTTSRSTSNQRYLSPSPSPTRAMSLEERAKENVRNAKRVILSGTRARKNMYKRGLLRSIDFSDYESDNEDRHKSRSTTRRAPSLVSRSDSPVRRRRRAISPESRSPSPCHSDSRSRRTSAESTSSARSEAVSRSPSPSSYRARLASARRNRRSGNRRQSVDYETPGRHETPGRLYMETPGRPSLSPSGSRHRRSPALHNIDFVLNYDSSDSESEVSRRSPVNHKRNTKFYDVSSFGITYDSDNEAVEDEDWRSQTRLRGLRA